MAGDHLFGKGGEIRLGCGWRRGRSGFGFGLGAGPTPLVELGGLGLAGLGIAGLGIAGLGCDRGNQSCRNDRRAQQNGQKLNAHGGCGWGTIQC